MEQREPGEIHLLDSDLVNLTAVQEAADLKTSFNWKLRDLKSNDHGAIVWKTTYSWQVFRGCRSYEFFKICNSNKHRKNILMILKYCWLYTFLILCNKTYSIQRCFTKSETSYKTINKVKKKIEISSSSICPNSRFF